MTRSHDITEEWADQNNYYVCYHDVCIFVLQKLTLAKHSPYQLVPFTEHLHSLRAMHKLRIEATNTINRVLVSNS